MEIHEAAENYLETIYILTKRLGSVRSIDVCNELNYAKPTVSIVMKNFREGGYITMDEFGNIKLTDTGLAIAQRMYERHLVIADILMTLGVDEETAYEDACKIEHDISEKSFQCMKAHFQKRLK